MPLTIDELNELIGFIEENKRYPDKEKTGDTSAIGLWDKLTNSNEKTAERYYQLGKVYETLAKTTEETIRAVDAIQAIVQCKDMYLLAAKNGSPEALQSLLDNKLINLSNFEETLYGFLSSANNKKLPTAVKNLFDFVAAQILAEYRRNSLNTSTRTRCLHVLIAYAAKLLNLEVLLERDVVKVAEISVAPEYGYRLLMALRNIDDFYLHELLSRCYASGKHSEANKPDFSKAAQHYYYAIRAQAENDPEKMPPLKDMVAVFDGFLKESNKQAVTTAVKLIKAAACDAFFHNRIIYDIASIETIETALIEAGENRRAQETLAKVRYRKGELLLKQKNYDAAQDCFEAAKISEPLAWIGLAKISWAKNLIVQTINCAWQYFINTDISYKEKLKIFQGSDITSKLFGSVWIKFQQTIANPTPEYYVLIATAYSCDAGVRELVNANRKNYPKECQGWLRGVLSDDTAAALYKLALSSKAEVPNAARNAAGRYFVDLKASKNDLLSAVSELWQLYFVDAGDKNKNLAIQLAALNALALIAIKKLNDEKNDLYDDRQAVHEAKVYFCLLCVCHQDQVNLQRLAVTFTKEIRDNSKTKSYYEAFVSANALISKLPSSSVEQNSVKQSFESVLASLQPIVVFTDINTNRFFAPASAASASPLPLEAVSIQSLQSRISQLTYQRDSLEYAFLLKKTNANFEKNFYEANGGEEKLELIWEYFKNLSLKFDDKYEFLTRKNLWVGVLEQFSKQSAIPEWETFVLLGDACRFDSRYPAVQGQLLSKINELNLKARCATFSWPLEEAKAVYLYKRAAFQGGNDIAVKRLLECYENGSVFGGLHAYVCRLRQGYFDANSVNTFGTTPKVQQAMMHGLAFVANKPFNGEGQNDLAIRLAKVWLSYFYYLDGTDNADTQKLAAEINSHSLLLKQALATTVSTQFPSLEIADELNNWRKSIKSAQPIAVSSSSNDEADEKTQLQEKIEKLQGELKCLQSQLSSNRNHVAKLGM